MWNEILNESRSIQRFDNTPVLILGQRHSGKRTFIDSLYDVSKTEMPKKEKAVAETARLRDKNLTSVIDYAYLNVVNLRDPDNKTYAKLQLFLIDDDQNKEIFEVLVSNPQLLSRMFVVIMLDFSAPWNFMTEITRWTTFLNQLLAKAGLTISQLDQMKQRVSRYYRSYKEPKYDEEGRFLKKQAYDQTAEELQVEIPLPEGVLTSNMRMPLIISVNKADLQTTVFREKNTEKIGFVQYHLRDACMKYGATLIYTSTKNNSNLNVFYEYILHRAYNFPLRFKLEAVNEEEIFVPLGSDNPTLLKESIKIFNQPYSDVVVQPPAPVDNRAEIPLIDDAQFFKKYEATAVAPRPIVPEAPVAQTPTTAAKPAEERNPTQRSEELMNFYDSLMKNPSGRNDSRRLSAQQQLNRQMSRIGNNPTDGRRLLQTIRKEPTATLPQPPIQEEKNQEQSK